MTTRSVATESGFAAWFSPTRVAMVGTVVVLLLLALPIQARGPGDHEKKSCGNAVRLDLGPWRGAGAAEYWDQAYQTCTSQRLDRVTQAVGVVSATVLIATMLSARARRRGPSDGSGH